MKSTAVYLPYLDAIRAWLNGEYLGGHTLTIPVISKDPHRWLLDGSPADASPVITTAMVYRRKFLAPAPWAGKPYVYVIPIAVPEPNSEICIVAGEAERVFYDRWPHQPMPEWWGRDGPLPPIPG